MYACIYVVYIVHTLCSLYMLHIRVCVYMCVCVKYTYINNSSEFNKTNACDCMWRVCAYTYILSVCLMVIVSVYRSPNGRSVCRSIGRLEHIATDEACAKESEKGNVGGGGYERSVVSWSLWFAPFASVSRMARKKKKVLTCDRVYVSRKKKGDQQRRRREVRARKNLPSTKYFFWNSPYFTSS
jgi:hypothetical protein